ncbi:MAG: histidinol-phosphate transaminase [Nitrospiraceae bacterium]|nr:MAG: histidinol-phosphate transaminase [Nitrospiraceae bacterium]
MPMIKAPDHISSIQPYVPGKPVEELERELGISGSVKLASNENPVGPSPRALRALRAGMSSLNRYPDGSCYYLRKALAERLGADPDELIFGNGSNEIIELAVRTFLSPGDAAVMAHPSFIVYASIVQAMNGKSIVVPLKDWRHDLKAMASKITKKTKIVFIANPNNPTGTINRRDEMDAFMKKVPEGVLVVVDEAYYEYVSSPDYPDCMHYLREGRDILILRTFSKMYGLAGLRIGYGIAPAPVAEEMNKVRQPFNINSLAQLAAAAALQDRQHVARTKKINEEGKAFLYAGLERLNAGYVPTEANFIFVPLAQGNAAEIYTALLKKGIIVRPMGPSALRITIGLPEENRRLVRALKQVKALF